LIGLAYGDECPAPDTLTWTGLGETRVLRPSSHDSCGTPGYTKEQLLSGNAAKLEATTGLKLERAQVPVQILVIVSAERPSPN
jgi:hypothetical protein